MQLNAIDFATLQAALDAANDGDRVYVPNVPGKVWSTVSGVPFRITCSLELYGDGVGTAGLTDGTVLVPGGANQDVLSIEPPSPGNTIDSVYLHDFKINSNMANPFSPVPPQRAIVCVLAAGKSVQSLRLDRIWALNAVGDGLHLEGANGADSYIDRLVISNCAAGSSGGWGAYLKWVRHLRMLRSECGGNALGGLYCENVGACLYTSGFEGNGPSSAGQVPVRSVHLMNCDIADLDACRFEGFTKGSVRTALRLEQCRGATQVTGNNFVYPGLSTDPAQLDSTGIEAPAGTGPLNILGCGFTRVHPDLIKIDSTDLGATVWPQYNYVEPFSGMIQPGSITQPAGDNRGLMSLPYVRRQVENAGITDSLVGMIFPAIPSSSPTGPVQNGMIYYRTSPAGFRARIAGQWKTINVQI